MEIRFINTKIHGLLDYACSMLLLTSPWLFDFYKDGLESWLPMLLGVAMLAYSLLTNYELGLMPKGYGFSLTSHHYLDLCLGTFLLISPLLFDFGEYIYFPHHVLGFLIILLSIFTDRITSEEFRDHAERNRLYYIGE